MKLKEGQRVKIKNLKYMWSDENDYSESLDYWELLIGQVVTCTGYTEHRLWRDEDYDNYDEDNDDGDDHRTSDVAYEMNVIDPDGDECTLYFFKHNFELLSSEPPKDDIEWLDRIQMNFKY